VTLLAEKLTFLCFFQDSFPGIIETPAAKPKRNTSRIYMIKIQILGGTAFYALATEKNYELLTPFSLTAPEIFTTSHVIQYSTASSTS